MVFDYCVNLTAFPLLAALSSSLQNDKKRGDYNHTERKQFFHIMRTLVTKARVLSLFSLHPWLWKFGFGLTIVFQDHNFKGLTINLSDGQFSCWVQIRNAVKYVKQSFRQPQKITEGIESKIDEFPGKLHHLKSQLVLLIVTEIKTEIIFKFDKNI